MGRGGLFCLFVAQSRFILHPFVAGKRCCLDITLQIWRYVFSHSGFPLCMFCVATLPLLFFGCFMCFEFAFGSWTRRWHACFLRVRVCVQDARARRACFERSCLRRVQLRWRVQVCLMHMRLVEVASLFVWLVVVSVYERLLAAHVFAEVCLFASMGILFVCFNCNALRSLVQTLFPEAWPTAMFALCWHVCVCVCVCADVFGTASGVAFHGIVFGSDAISHLFLIKFVIWIDGRWTI